MKPVARCTLVAYNSRMQVTAYHTSKVKPGDALFHILDTYLPPLTEKTVVVVTSKIISICQGRVVKNDGTVDKHDLIRKEADLYIDSTHSRYDVFITIKDNILIASSGIDESNGDGYFILWPKNVHEEAKNIWNHLRKKYALKHVGVVITDSRATPLRWGILGVGIAWCGFEALKNYIDTPDIFGRKLRMTKQSVLDGLAATAVLVMGEGSEQTPLALVQKADIVSFQERPPTKREINMLRIQPKDDLFHHLLTSPLWKKGGNP